MVELVGSHSRVPEKRSAGKATPRTPTKGRLEQRLADAPVSWGTVQALPLNIKSREWLRLVVFEEAVA